MRASRDNFFQPRDDFGGQSKKSLRVRKRRKEKKKEKNMYRVTVSLVSCPTTITTIPCHEKKREKVLVFLSLFFSLLSPSPTSSLSFSFLREAFLFHFSFFFLSVVSFKRNSSRDSSKRTLACLRISRNERTTGTRPSNAPLSTNFRDRLSPRVEALSVARVANLRPDDTMTRRRRSSLKTENIILVSRCRRQLEEESETEKRMIDVYSRYTARVYQRV